MSDKIVSFSTGIVGDLMVEIHRAPECRDEFVLEFSRGGIPESQFTFEEIQAIKSAIMELECNVANLK